MEATNTQQTQEGLSDATKAIVTDAINLKGELDITLERSEKVEKVFDSLKHEETPFTVGGGFNASAKDHIQHAKNKTEYWTEEEKALNAQERAEKAKEQLYASRAVGASDTGRQMGQATEVVKRMTLLQRVSSTFWGFWAKGNEARALGEIAKVKTLGARNLSGLLEQQKPQTVQEAMGQMEQINQVLGKQEKSVFKMLKQTTKNYIPLLENK